VNPQRSGFARGHLRHLVRQGRIPCGAKRHLPRERGGTPEVDGVRQEIPSARAEANACFEIGADEKRQLTQLLQGIVFTAISIGEPTEIMKPPTCCSVTSRLIRPTRRFLRARSRDPRPDELRDTIAHGQRCDE
jgi:hypothetical protein